MDVTEGHSLSQGAVLLLFWLKRQAKRALAGESAVPGANLEVKGIEVYKESRTCLADWVRDCLGGLREAHARL